MYTQHRADVAQVESSSTKYKGLDSTPCTARTSHSTSHRLDVVSQWHEPLITLLEQEAEGDGSLGIQG